MLYDYLEMLLFIIATLILSFFSGLLIDNIFYIDILKNSTRSIYSKKINSEITSKDNLYSNISTLNLIFNIILHIILIVISFYYIKKIIYLFPNKSNYKINIYVEIAMIYISVQTNFYDKILLLKKRIFNNDD